MYFFDLKKKEKRERERERKGQGKTKAIPTCMYNLILETPLKTNPSVHQRTDFDRMSGATHSWVIFP